MTGAAKSEPTSFREWLTAPTTMAGAITGGTIGAFTGNPIGAAVGMLLGAVTASAIHYYVTDQEKATSNGKTHTG
jgi:hypothetical protein